ncbi:MAG: hypothetical protein AB9835_07840 [Eubacteriales bacterium]
MSEKYPSIPLIGCDSAINAVLSALDSSRLSHAYLVEGAPGCGKYTFALHMAAHILSHGLSEADRARQHRRALERSHTDLSVLEPENEGARGFKVDAIRALSQDIHILPYEGERKVYILRDCQRMNESTQNAFLKSLEEPPSFTVFFLLSSGRDFCPPSARAACPSPCPRWTIKRWRGYSGKDIPAWTAKG